MTTGYGRVLEAAEGLDIIESKNGSKFSARCPAHEDRRASLSVAAGDGNKALVFCFAGCSIQDVVSALGLSMTELFGEGRKEWDAAQYIYTDEAGDPLIRVTRTYPKGFRQERWEGGTWKSRVLDTRRTVYNLPEVAKADDLWMVEGEKDVESLRMEGVVATTLMGGTGKWKDEYANQLRGKTIQIIADRDKASRNGHFPGLEGALKVRNGLRGIAKGLQVWLPPEGYKDVTDMLNAGLGLGDLVLHEFDTSTFEPMDWESWSSSDTTWLLEPYIPAGSRVLAFGPAGSLKSLWAMWVAIQLAKEGHKTAYFSLEMSPREVAKRLNKMQPPKDRFKLFRRLSFDSSEDLAAACDLLRGYSLIVIDSWSSVHGDQNNNDEIARLDREFFLPLIEETNASLLVLDNTGQPMMTNQGKITPTWARGASAKGDKMDVTIMFERPEESDNHTARLRVMKMRPDIDMPKPVLVRTDNDEIDFRFIDKQGADLGSMWDSEAPPPPPLPDVPESVLDKLKKAREEMLKETQ